MILTVYVYPGYSGETIEEVGNTEAHWENMWSNETYGSGILELEISVETNQAPASFLPGSGDDNEEVNIEWAVSFFEVIVKETPM